MKRIGLSLFVTVLAVVSSAFGQQIPNVQYPNSGNFDFSHRNEVNFSTPGTIGQRVNASFTNGEVAPIPSAPFPGATVNAVPRAIPSLQSQDAIPAASQPRSLPTLPAVQPAAPPPVVAQVPMAQAPMAQVPAPVPAQATRPVAQNAITQNYRLRLPPQVFERNLVEKLGSRFIPIRSTTEITGISRYNLPGRDGTNIELIVYQQQGVVSVVGSPRMVEATLQIVRLLDTADIPGSAVTRFVPVQQSNVESARRIADIMNRESVRVAQVDRPPTAVPGAPQVAAAPADETAIGDPSLGRVLSPVNIDVISEFGTIVIQGTPNDVAVIQETLKQLEQLSLENEPVIELIPMIHADSLRVSTLVQTLYAQVYLNRRGPIFLLPLVKPNTILIIGRKESIEAAKELINKLDTPVDPTAAFKIFHLKFAAAQELSPIITQSITSRPGYNAANNLAAQVSIVPDFRTNTLIVHASKRDMDEIEAMIRQMDIPGSGIDGFMRTFQLKNALATEMVTVLVNALSGTATGRGAMLSIQRADVAEGAMLRGSIMYNVAISADTRSNSLIVTAPAETLPLIEALIYQLDRLPAAESRIRVFTLVNGDASALTTVLTNLFATGAANQVTTTRPGIEEGDSSLVGVRFQAEIRTNSIIAIGGEGDLATAEALLLRLDAENLNNRRIFTMRLVNTPAEEIAPILTNYVTNERAIITQNIATFLPVSPMEQYQMDTYVAAEPISNSLIISTTPQYYEQIRRIVMDLDERPLMIAIDVVIAEVTLSNSTDRGVELALQDSILFNSAAGTTGSGLLNPGNIPFVRSAAGGVSPRSIGTQGVTSLNMPNTGGFSFAASGESLSMFIRALETRNKTQVLSRPQLKTLHNRRAQIQVGGSLPYVGDMQFNNAGNPVASTSQLDIGTILDITPRIMSDGMVAIAVYIERSGLEEWVDIGNGARAPATNMTTAQTTINAFDGQTVIFAGLISETKTTGNTSIPGLNKIPFVKHLFEYDSKDCRRTELLIMMTPRIIRTQEDMEMMNQQERERMHWCISDVVKMTGDNSIKRRSDEWNEVQHRYGTPTQLQDSQLPQEKKPIMVPVLPTTTEMK